MVSVLCLEGGRENQLFPLKSPLDPLSFKPIFPIPLRIHGSIGAITRATLEAILRYNMITSKTINQISFTNVIYV